MHACSPEAVDLDQVAELLVHDQAADDQLLIKLETIHGNALAEEGVRVSGLILCVGLMAVGGEADARASCSNLHWRYRFVPSRWPADQETASP